MNININSNNKFNFASRISAREENKGSSNMLSKNKTEIAAAAAIVSGVTLAAGIIGAKKELITVLKKNGISFENNVAKTIKNGELYTGCVQRNIKHFGLKKEKVKFVDGKIRERLQYNLFGHEMKGYFYKNDKLVAEVSIINPSPSLAKSKAFTVCTFDETGKVMMAGDGFCKKNKSVFEQFSNKYRDN